MNNGYRFFDEKLVIGKKILVGSLVARAENMVLLVVGIPDSEISIMTVIFFPRFQRLAHSLLSLQNLFPGYHRFGASSRQARGLEGFRAHLYIKYFFHQFERVYKHHG